jgi:hypothetical protein
MNIKSILKPEGSVVSGMAVSGGVLAIYAMQLGPVTQAHASDANHPVNESSRKKAAVMSFLFVATLTVLTKDANVGILGWGTQVAADISYRHAIMADPTTGAMVNPGESAYLPAGNSVPLQSQGQSAIEAGGY